MVVLCGQKAADLIVSWMSAGDADRAPGPRLARVGLRLLGAVLREAMPVAGAGGGCGSAVGHRARAGRGEAAPAAPRVAAAPGAPPLETIVVDDGSRDRTAEIAAALGARVLPAPPLPPGWTGKTWACASGAAAARGEYLLFLDADTALEPGGLERMLRLPAAEPGVHSVCPYHRVERPYEGLSAFFNIVMVAGMNAFTPLGTRARRQGMFGQAMLVRREDYLAAGGHGAVKGRILENLFLAREFRAKGIATACRAGRGAISMRMFPRGRRRSRAAGGRRSRRGRRRRRRRLSSPSRSGSRRGDGVRPPRLVAARGGARGRRGGPLRAFAAQVFWFLRRIGSYSPMVAVLFPVPLIFYFAVFGQSALKARLGKATSWRGRDVVDGR